MNVLITHFASYGNKGDGAILLGVFEQIRSVFPSARITVLTLDGEEPKPVFNETYLPSFFYIAIFTVKNPVYQIFKMLYVVGGTILWSLLARSFGLEWNFLLLAQTRRTIKAYKEADLILPTGGGYITGTNTLQGTVTVFMQLHAIAIGTLLKKPVILCPQSIGPFGNRVQEILASAVLKRVTYIFARESYTLQTLLHLRVPADRIGLAPDAAFLLSRSSGNLPGDLYAKRRANAYQPIVGITVRKWFSREEEQDAYEKEIAKFIDTAVAQQNASIICIPQVIAPFGKDDDRETSERVWSRLHSKQSCILITDNYSIAELKKIYARCDVLVGTRMHSCIFALTELVPVVAIAYEYKTDGIMGDLGLSEWVVPIGSVTGDILAKRLEELLARRSAYAMHLEDRIPKVVAKAQEIGTRIQYLLKEQTRVA